MRPTSVLPGLTRRDGAYMAALLLPAFLLFLVRVLLGETYFWGDLLYLHHPWKAFAAESAARGVLPLWNPYIYLGMPFAAQMQSAVWYPGSLPFYFFGFAPAFALFTTLHYFLAGAFSFLWLRRCGRTRSASAAGALVFMLCGGMISRIPFLNHVSTIAFFPAFLLLASRPVLLALSFSLAFLSGYPTMLAGQIAAAWLIDTAWNWRRRPRLVPWIAAGVLSLGMTACLLFPAGELAMGSKRGGGMAAGEVLTWSYKPADLVQMTAPPLIPSGEYSPSVNWWKTSYFGVGGCAAALLGVVSAGALGAAAAVAYLGGVVLLLLGDSNALSLGLWTYLIPLNYVRYPGNMVYLLSPMMALLVAIGLHRRKWSRIAAVLIGVELLFYAWNSQPMTKGDYFTDSGPLVSVLRRELGSHRYLLSPLALHWQKGVGGDPVSASQDLKHRLYGLTNSPYRLSSVGNFGEPLVPQPSYDFMDFIFSRPSLAAAARWLDWADVRILMTRDRLPSGNLRYLGDSLWHLYENPGTLSRAYWFTESEGSSIAEGLGGPPPTVSGIPVVVDSRREDRFSVSGSFDEPGWLYVSEPLGPGWRVSMESGELSTLPALRVFKKMRVPAGEWTVRFRYAPRSWGFGRGVTLLFIMGLAAYWYNRLLNKMRPGGRSSTE